MIATKTKLTKPQPFKMPTAVSLGELLDRVYPPQRPLLEPWLPERASCLLYAETGAGKSMLSQTLALAVAGGGSVLGWECAEPRRVLYVDGEMSEETVHKRFRLLQTTIEGGDLAAVRKNLHVMSRTMQTGAGDFLDIANRDQHEAVLEYVRSGRFEFVVFDNFSVLTDKIEEENSAAAMKPMQTLLAHLKKYAAVLLVHHCGKSKQSFRGSTAIATTFERIIGVTKSESVPSDVIDVWVKFDKYRDEKPAGFRNEFPLSFASAPQPDGSSKASWAVGGNSQTDEGWVMFTTGRHPTKKAFLEAFDTRFGTKLAPRKFYRLKKEWLDSGRKPEDIAKAEERMEAYGDVEAEAEAEAREAFTGRTVL